MFHVYLNTFVVVVAFVFNVPPTANVIWRLDTFEIVFTHLFVIIDLHGLVWARNYNASFKLRKT